MPLWYLLILAALQGITEFLPVSSSAHLILLPALTGLPDQGTFLDVAVHLGTLGAVVLYFRADVARAVRGLPRMGRASDPDGRLALALLIATIPVILFGLALRATVGTEALRSVALIGWTTLLFGILLWLADRFAPERVRPWTLRDALLMGIAQALALIPGTSRSGVTITAARALGYERHEAARLAMLMSIPTILASGAVLATDVVGEADWPLMRDAAVAALFAFAAALGALHGMMRLLASVSFTPYVLYRVALGLGLLAWAYG